MDDTDDEIDVIELFFWLSQKTKMEHHAHQGETETKRVLHMHTNVRVGMNGTLRSSGRWCDCQNHYEASVVCELVSLMMYCVVL